MSCSEATALFAYPARSVLGRNVPKNRIVAAGKPDRRLRDELTAKVARIVWQHKLAPETVNLAASAAVPEIQIFNVVLKPAGASGKLPIEVLRCIDRAIGFPLIFELMTRREDGAPIDQVRVVASYKRRSEADTSQWVISEYFATDWLPADTPRAPLPVALDLPRLYELMLGELIPLRAREGESMAALVERHGEIAAAQRECERLEARLHREKQFNRKVEINRHLREQAARLEALRT